MRDLHPTLSQAGPGNASAGKALPVALPKRARLAGKGVDDFPRLVTGFIIGFVMAVFMGVADALLLDYILRSVRPSARPAAEWWLVGFSLAQCFVLSGLPIVGAALLATQDRVDAARQTLSYCFSIFVLFVVVCGRPLGIGPACWLVLMGLGGLAGVCCVALLDDSRWRKAATQ
jgi:hypothetical protein